MALFSNGTITIEAHPITERTKVSTKKGPVPAWPGDWLLRKCRVYKGQQSLYTLCDKATFFQVYTPIDEAAKALWKVFYGEENTHASAIQATDQQAEPVTH